MKTMSRFIILVCLCGLTLPLMTAADGEKGKYLLKNLDPQIQKPVLQALKDLGIKPVEGAVVLAITTDDCPTFCNDKVAGGYCRCGRDENGNCPEGTTESLDNPKGKECKVKPTSGLVGGGGMTDPAEVIIP